MAVCRTPRASLGDEEADAVITRKVGGCNKTLWGALVHGVLASIMVSCRRQGKRFLELARRLWQTSDPPAIPLEALPGG